MLGFGEGAHRCCLSVTRSQQRALLVTPSHCQLRSQAVQCTRLIANRRRVRALTLPVKLLPGERHDPLKRRDRHALGLARCRTPPASHAAAPAQRLFASALTSAQPPMYGETFEACLTAADAPRG
jgi:hypothetical protein